MRSILISAAPLGTALRASYQCGSSDIAHSRCSFAIVTAAVYPGLHR